VFSLLRPGDYQIRVEAPGFKSVNLPRFTLTVEEHRREDLAMTVGEQSETVQVSTEPPALQADSTTLGDTLEPQAVQAVPAAWLT